MTFKKLARFHLAAAAFLAAAPLATSAFAQAGVSPGMQVVDQAGNPVGTVTVVRGSDLVLKTDRHEVQLPASSFTPSEGKLLFAMTRDQLNAETDRALAELAAAVAVGAEVRDSAGQIAGTIEELDDGIVTLKLVSGELVRLPRHGVAGSQNGAVLGVTVAELKAMAGHAADGAHDGAEDGAQEGAQDDAR